MVLIPSRGYWMIYRGSGFLAVVWFGSTPNLPPFHVSKHDQRSKGRPRNTTCWWERGGAKSLDRKKGRPSINNSILSGFIPPPPLPAIPAPHPLPAESVYMAVLADKLFLFKERFLLGEPPSHRIFLTEVENFMSAKLSSPARRILNIKQQSWEVGLIKPSRLIRVFLFYCPKHGVLFSSLKP